MTLQETVTLTGDQAVAYAARQCNVDLVAAYPITPQTIIVEALSEYVANGEMKARYVNVESEHSAMSACIGGSLAGGRVFTATASQGLALMHEVIYAASGLRCPIVLAVATRALSAPINIHGDHSDVMGSRDAGAIQLFSENIQEAYDQTILAFKLAERDDVLLPVMVNFDGFLITHTMENLKVLDDATVSTFLPPRKASQTIDARRPMAFGVFAFPEHYLEFKRQQEEGMRNASRAVGDVWEEYRAISGRTYQKLTPHRMEDAEVALVSMGTTSSTARYAVDKLREEGVKAGALGVRLYRPFPTMEVQKSLNHVEAVAVFDRALSSGAFGGPLFMDVASALYGETSPPTLVAYVYGLGGRDVRWMDLAGAARRVMETHKSGVRVLGTQFLGLRE